MRYMQATWRALNDTRHMCHYCGRALNSLRPCRENIALRTLDHIVPQSRGGANSPTNYVYACAQCNQLKAQLTLNEFRAALETMICQRVEFFGDARRPGWRAPRPLICVGDRRPMIAQMEFLLIKRFHLVSPKDHGNDV